MFRAVGLTIMAAYLRWFALLPLAVILVTNFYLAQKAGITASDDKLITAAISVMIPAVYVYNDNNKLAMPTIQQTYYAWNRVLITLILFLSNGLVTLLLNTKFVEHLPDLMPVLQFNTTLVPLVLAPGIISLMPMVCGKSAWINKPLKYKEKISVDNRTRRFRRGDQSLTEFPGLI